jgi:uncharacterized membrane protein (DUF2068 family)
VLLNRGAATVAVVRGVAVFEAFKGLLVIAVGFGLLHLVHRDAQEAAEALVRHMHINPARHYPRVFIEAAGRVGDLRLVLLALGAFAYSTLRLVEAYGLWFVRHWAEWIAILSSGLYLPVEVVELLRKSTVTRALILLGNVLIVVAMLYVRFRVPDEEIEATVHTHG